MKSLLPSNATENNSQVDISPLLDMVFILLIFFVVTSNFTKESGVDLERPQSSQTTQLSSKSILLAIPSDGSLFFNDEPMGLVELESRIRLTLSQDSKRPVVLIADKHVSTGYLVQVMGICKKAGATKVSVSAEAQ